PTKRRRFRCISNRDNPEIGSRAKKRKIRKILPILWHRGLRLVYFCSKVVGGRSGAMAFAVREIQPTPNPNAAKFILDRPVSDRPMSFFNAASAKGHVVAEELFVIPGVSSLLLLGDFITVNKTPDADWDEITQRVQAVLKTCRPK